MNQRRRTPFVLVIAASSVAAASGCGIPVNPPECSTGACEDPEPVPDAQDAGTEAAEIEDAGTEAAQDAGGEVDSGAADA